MLSYCIIRHHLETCFHGCFSPATSHFEGRLTVAYCATTARQMTIEIRYRCLASCCYRWLVAVRANLLSRVPGRRDERTFFISSANYRSYPEKSYTNRPSTEAYTSSGTLYLMSTKEIIPWSVKKKLGGNGCCRAVTFSWPLRLRGFLSARHHTHRSIDERRRVTGKNRNNIRKWGIQKPIITARQKRKG